MKLRIQINDISLQVACRDTPTAKSIFNSLPIESKAQTWGDETYFSIPVVAELEPDAKDVINAGEMAFWVEGSCIAIGFGPTPISQGDEIRLAARTNIWGDTNNDVKQLTNVKAGDKVIIVAVD